MNTYAVRLDYYSVLETTCKIVYMEYLESITIFSPKLQIIYNSKILIKLYIYISVSFLISNFLALNHQSIQ